MEIKDITIKRINSDGLKAICSINFENLFVVHGIRLIKGKDGMFLSFPAKVKDGNSFLDVAHPINSEFRQKITDEIIKKYEST